ncbi:MAG: DHHA1 domain-containing protein [Ignisphaera sp.]|nr:DHHA1 domain-containing protein [Ignisphaera sp.]MDW8084837.1 DHHA1 domain-containing protein [Ignisphaera sp.]
MQCIVTHTDLDGVISAAVYIVGTGVGKDGYSVLFIEPAEVAEKLCSLASRGVCRAVAVMDIGMGGNILRELLKCISSGLGGVRVSWYDHHIWDPRWIEELSRYVDLHVDAGSKCAAGVVAKSLNLEAAVVMEYVDVTCAVDSWDFHRWEAPYLYRYVDYIKRFYGLDRAFRDVLDAIERGVEVRQFAEWVEPFVERYMDEELRILASMCMDVRELDVEGKRVCIYYRDFDIPNQSIVGNALLSMCGCSIAAIVRPDLSSISFRSRDFNVREIAGKLGGGGHQRAAGAPLKISSTLRISMSLPLPAKLKRTLLYNYIEKLLKNAITSI